MTTQEVAEKYVSLYNSGKAQEIVDTLYADDIVSIEPPGSPDERTHGIEEKRKKEAGFNETVEEWHAASVSEPLVADNFFSVTMGMDITMKGAGRIKMNEVCVFGVENGKINREHFYYTPEPTA